jgi:hypothetical protein
VLDYTAMLHFIETNWNLRPLSVRDRQSAGLASAFDFAAPPRAGTLLSWTWPAPKVRAATDSPTPVIYSVYGAAAALAIAVMSLAVYRRGPITVPGIVGRGAILVRSGVESMRDQMQRFLHGRRYSLRALASWAGARRSEEDRSKPPARFSDSGPPILTIPSRPRPGVVSDGQDSSVELYQAKKHALAESRNGHVPASTALAVIGQEREEQSNVILEPTIGDGQVSGEQSASDVKAETDAEVETEMQTDPAAGVKPPTEAEPASSAKAEPPTGADAEEPADVETSAVPVHSRAARHQRRNLSRSQRRNLSRSQRRNLSRR